MLLVTREEEAAAVPTTNARAKLHTYLLSACARFLRFVAPAMLVEQLRFD